MINRAEVIVVTGVRGAGKSTIGRLLAARFARGTFVEADVLQQMIVSGGAWATDSQSGEGPGGPTGEAAAQLRLRLRNACLVRSFRSVSGSGSTRRGRRQSNPSKPSSNASGPKH